MFPVNDEIEGFQPAVAGHMPEIQHFYALGTYVRNQVFFRKKSGGFVKESGQLISAYF
jgi:hypothetical protein